MKTIGDVIKLRFIKDSLDLLTFKRKDYYLWDSIDPYTAGYAWFLSKEIVLALLPHSPDVGRGIIYVKFKEIKKCFNIKLNDLDLCDRCCVYQFLVSPLMLATGFVNFLTLFLFIEK